MAMRMVCLRISIFLGIMFTLVSLNAAPVRVGEVYAVTVFQMTPSPDGTSWVESPVDAKLWVLNDSSGTMTTPTLELPESVKPGMVRVPRSEMPESAAPLFGEETDFTFSHRTMGRGATTRYNLAEKIEKISPEVARQTGRMPTPDRPKEYHFVDPTGKPAVGLSVVVRAKWNLNGQNAYLLLGEGTLSGDARLRLKWPRLLAPEGSSPDSFGFNPSAMMMNSSELEVTDPATGMVEKRTALSYPTYGDVKLPEGRVALALFGSGNAETTAPAYFGEVQDENGAPVQANINMHWLQTPGHGGVQLDMGISGSLITAPDGKFRIGVPVTALEKISGQTIPPISSALRVLIAATDGRSGKQETSLIAGKNNVILLTHTENLKIRLLENNGQPLQNFLKRAQYDRNIRLQRVDGATSPTSGGHMIMNPVDDTGLVELGGVPVPAHYYLEWRGVRYEGTAVARGSEGTVLVFTGSDEHARVEGRVVNAVTGAPVTGAYLAMSFEGSAAWTLANMDAAKRDEIYNRVANEGIAAVTDEGGNIRLGEQGKSITWFSITALGRTGADGRYAIDLPPGKFAQGIVAYAPGYVPMKANLSNFGSEENRRNDTVKMSDALLVPSAEATVTVVAPKTVPDPFLRNENGEPLENFTVNIVVSYDAPASWAVAPHGLNPIKTDPWEYEEAASWTGVNGETKIFVPAGVKFNVSASNSYKPVVGIAFWKDQGPVAAGATVDLGKRELPVKRPFLVVVRKADGTLAPGVAVTVDGGLQRMVTDDRGEAIGWADGSVGRVEAMADLGWKVAASAKDVDIPSTGPLVRVELKMP